MARAPARPADISLIEFRHALVDQGFCWLTPIGQYIDIRHPRPGRYLAPVTDTRGRILRQKTLDALLAWRTEAEAEKARDTREAARRQAIAEAIAPCALPVARSSLQGAEAVAQLADDFIVASTRADGVVKADLLRMGWLAEQLREHAETARAVAYRRQEGVAA